MSAPMHTPLLVDYLATSSGIAIRNSRGAIVAVCKHHPSEDMIGSEADRFARLFASAPELLEALEAITPFADDMTDTGLQAIAHAKAAIAKARGAA